MREGRAQKRTRPHGSGPRREDAFRNARLALAELLAAARAVQSDLLALDLARVAGDKPRAAQVGLECRVVVDQRTRDAVAHRAGLAGFAATMHVDPNVERAVVVGEHQRLLDHHDGGLAAEVLLNRLPVASDFALALLENNTPNDRFPPPVPEVP